MGRSSTGGSYPKSPNRMMDHPSKVSSLLLKNAYLNRMSIKLELGAETTYYISKTSQNSKCQN